MQTYQFIIPIVAILFWIYTTYQYIKGRNTLLELIFWSVIWIVIILLALFPDFFTVRLAKLLGIESNINALLFLAIGILFFFQFRLYFLIKRQNMIITDLVRKLALKDDEEGEQK